MGELGTLLAGSGVFGVLATVIIYLLFSFDRSQRTADERIAKAESRADDWAGRHRETQRLLDEARADRRAAEDRADRLERQVRDLDAEVKELRAEVGDLRSQLGGGRGLP